MASVLRRRDQPSLPVDLDRGTVALDTDCEALDGVAQFDGLAYSAEEPATLSSVSIGSEAN